MESDMTCTYNNNTTPTHYRTSSTPHQVTPHVTIEQQRIEQSGAGQDMAGQIK
jgi:hypothetical protein